MVSYNKIYEQMKQNNKRSSLAAQNLFIFLNLLCKPIKINKSDLKLRYLVGL